MTKPKLEPEQETNKNGSPCPEFWDWLPKAYNFEGDGNFTKYNMEVAFLAGKQASQPEQEPVAMRMPKVGDKVICIEDDSLGEVEYLTAGGSPEIKFDDGSHGTYMLREFAELFRYATTPPQRTWVELTDEEILAVNMSTVTKLIDEPIVCDTDHNIIQLGKAIEAKLKDKNTKEQE